MEKTDSGERDSEAEEAAEVEALGHGWDEA